MGIRWWQLPGPAAFLARLVQDVREGNNVIVALPEHAPDGLDTALLRSLRDDGDWPWERLPNEILLAEDVSSALIRYFLPDFPPEARWNATALATASDFGGRIVWVEGITRTTWPTWRTFLTNYTHALRSREPYTRSLFIILLTGISDDATMVADVGLSVRTYRDCVDRLDLLFYTTHLLPMRPFTKIQRQVALHAIAHLALWDPAVADCLVDEPLETMLNPMVPLCRLADTRDWCQLNSRAPAWHCGVIDSLAGEGEQVHSAWLVLRGNRREIERRLWSAQVAVLFPYLEEQRRLLLNELKRYLQVPFKTRFGVVEDVHDLELGHIEAQISERNLPLTLHKREHLARLRLIRNKLAHLEALGAELLNV